LRCGSFSRCSSLAPEPVITVVPDSGTGDLVGLAKFYSTQRFNLPGLRAEIVNRIVLGNKVIDHERVWGVRDTPIEIAAVYEVVGQLIERVWFFPPE
jgi:hypothetical protein